MATYKKKGAKPGNKQEHQNLPEDDSTTAEVFNSLDEGASKTEEWVARNQKFIFIIIGVAAAGILGYLAYDQFIQEPAETEAVNEMFQAQQYFERALDAPAAEKDSLYNLALTGGQGKYGFVDVVENYGSTDAANLARYYAGMAYLRTNQYQEAINNLEEFEGDDQILTPLALGGIGDAFLQLEQPKDALDYYEKAATAKLNDFTTPRFLMKAAVTALQLNEAETAENFLLRIKNEFSAAPEAQNVEIFLGQAQAMQ